jgi:hypothetical protein
MPEQRLRAPRTRRRLRWGSSPPPRGQTRSGKIGRRPSRSPSGGRRGQGSGPGVRTTEPARPESRASGAWRSRGRSAPLTLSGSWARELVEATWRRSCGGAVGWSWLAIRVRWLVWFEDPIRRRSPVAGGRLTAINQSVDTSAAPRSQARFDDGIWRPRSSWPKMSADQLSSGALTGPPEIGATIGTGSAPPRRRPGPAAPHWRARVRWPRS